jgi:imidazoleglycerol-phosphate dehydratase/histidinol-phosphatase
MKKRVLFIDRDGTIIVEPKDTQQIDSLERLEFIPGAIGALSTIARHTDFELVLVTNQDGLGTPSFPEENFWPAHNKMLATLLGEGVQFSDIVIDRSFAHENKPTRKPGTALLRRYFGDEYDLTRSFVIGDRATDVQLALNLSARAIHFNPSSANPAEPGAVLATPSWGEIERFVVAQRYQAQLHRKTNETQIAVEVALQGSGQINISTGLGFFDHMLHLLGSHAGFDLTINATGDLHVDEHHLIEDVGITLGEAVRSALGNKVGLARYGFLLPMDEALAQVAIDLSGRAAFEWRAEFRREKIGTLPTEMLKHFFKSFSDAARCALHITVDGENEHHKAEAIFKGVGRALRMAVKVDPRSAHVPSTKGVL